MREAAWGGQQLRQGESGYQKRSAAVGESKIAERCRRGGETGQRKVVGMDGCCLLLEGAKEGGEGWAGQWR